MQQPNSTNKDNIQGSTLTTCPWQIPVKPGKSLTPKELQFNDIAQQLFDLTLDFKKEDQNCRNLLRYYYDKVSPAEKEYYNVTKKYIQHLHSVYKTHINQFTESEKDVFLNHYFDQIKIYFEDANMPEIYLTPSFEQTLPLDLDELWDATFHFRREYAYLLLISFGIGITPEDGKKVVDDDTLENLIKKLTNDYFIDTRVSKKQKWDNFSITANNLRKELHRQHINSLRKIELWNETKKMNNFIFHFAKNPKTDKKTTLWQTAYDNSRDINYDLISFKADSIMEKHLGTITELLTTGVIQSADLDNIIKILGSHIRLLQLIVPDFRLRHRLYLPIIAIGMSQTNELDADDLPDQKVDLQFLEEKIKFYNQKKAQKDNSSQILSKNNQYSVQFLKVILQSEPHLMDLYNVYWERDFFIVPETIS